MLCSLKSMSTSASLFIIWLVIGILIYLQYGYIQNRKAEVSVTEKELNINSENDKELVNK